MGEKLINMLRQFYTFWKSKEDDTDNALLLEEEPIFYTKHNAFKRAHHLASKLVDGWGYVILLRKIKIGSDICTEWVFPPE